MVTNFAMHFRKEVRNLLFFPKITFNIINSPSSANVQWTLGQTWFGFWINQRLEKKANLAFISTASLSFSLDTIFGTLFADRLFVPTTKNSQTFYEEEKNQCIQQTRKDRFEFACSLLRKMVTCFLGHSVTVLSIITRERSARAWLQTAFPGPKIKAVTQKAKAISVKYVQKNVK